MKQHTLEPRRIRRGEHKSNRARCTKCQRMFPEHLIQPYVTNVAPPQYVCPICALALSNEQHGQNRTEFSGEMAQQYLEEAQEYLRTISRDK